MAASRRIADRYGVYALPAFLMFYKGSLVYAGQLGGEKIRVASEFKPYKMLYVEPTFSDMIGGEKLLRKLRFSWDLCSSASEAQNLKQVAERASIEETISNADDMVMKLVTEHKACESLVHEAQTQLDILNAALNARPCVRHGLFSSRPSRALRAV